MRKFFFGCTFAVMMCFSSFPAFSGQVAVINPSSGASVSYGSPPSMTPQSPVMSAGSSQVNANTASSMLSSRKNTLGLKLNAMFDALARIDLSLLERDELEVLKSKLTQLKSQRRFEAELGQLLLAELERVNALLR
jgi:hypothetical protein